MQPYVDVVKTLAIWKTILEMHIPWQCQVYFNDILEHKNQSCVRCSAGLVKVK